MYENISGLLDLSETSRYKIAIIGEPKTGKSWFAATIPGSTFVADFDGREESIKEYIRKSGRKDIMVKAYKDLDPKFPKAVASLETDIAMFEYQKQQGKEIPQNYVLDSITYLRGCCERELIRQHPSMSRTLKLGVNEVRIPQGWDIVNGNRAYLEYLIGRISELGNIIAIFHEMDEKDVGSSTKEERRYTGRKTIQPQYLSTLLSVFNDVFRITIDSQGNRQVTCKPSSEFLASTTMSSLSETESPNLANMMEKHAKSA